MTDPVSSFRDPDAVARYADRTARLVPGLHDLHRMVGVLLAERTPSDARVLVLGAGGGLEARALAEMQPGWRFDGVDPSAEMLQLARTTLGETGARVTFHEGYIDSAPEGPFDAATCLLTLHFLQAAERERTVREVARRLRPGAPFAVAHHSFPTQPSEKDKWLGRNAAYSVASGGVSPSQAAGSIKAMKEHLPVLPPEQDEEILRKSGFAGIELFYTALTFRGWICRKEAS